MHNKCWLHRDLKPDNFLIGTGKNANTVYMIDFGVSKRYINLKTSNHILYSENQSLIGTISYASVNNHLGVEQSRRDDIESLGYVFINFFNGGLPWERMKGGSDRIKGEKVKNMKQEKSVRERFPSLPEEVH